MEIRTLSNQASPRKEQLEKLSWFLRNPGRFSILVTGDHGTGKTFWIEILQSELCQNDQAISGVHSVSLGTALPTFEFWEEAFRSASDKILLIEDVENVGNHEPWLVDALSTKDGKLGLGDPKYDIRPVFTSSLDISELRQNRELLSPKFFDRIAQLVVHLPPLTKTKQWIWSDFEAVWKGMEFKAQDAIPGATLKIWLEGNPEKLRGNFRDLQKLAILWHQFRLMGTEESEILGLVQEDFIERVAYPEENTKLEEGFFFQRGKTYDELMKGFRMAVKRWARKEYGDLKIAADKLGMNHRTFERW